MSSFPNYSDIGEAGPSTYQGTQGAPSTTWSNWVNIAAEGDAFEDITADLTEDDLDVTADLSELAQTKPRQNSFDFVIAAFREHESRQGLQGLQAPADEQVSSTSETVLEEPCQAHVRAPRFRLQDYLPGLQGDVDCDHQDIELGLYSSDVRREDGVRETRVHSANSRPRKEPKTVLGKLMSWLSLTR